MSDLTNTLRSMYAADQRRKPGKPRKVKSALASFKPTKQGTTQGGRQAFKPRKRG